MCCIRIVRWRILCRWVGDGKCGHDIMMEGVWCGEGNLLHRKLAMIYWGDSSLIAMKNRNVRISNETYVQSTVRSENDLNCARKTMLDSSLKTHSIPIHSYIETSQRIYT